MPTTMDLGTYRGNAEVACCSFLYSLWDASDLNNIAAIVRNCLIARNTATDTGANGRGGGFYIGTGGRIESCTIVSNSASGDGGGGGVYRVSGTAGTVSNSIVYFNTASASVNSNAYSTVTAGWAYNCTTNPVVAGDGCITDDPLFVDLAGGNYTLATGSPCIDKGANQDDWMAGALDLAGNTRKQWGRVLGSKAAPIVDMGAYEAPEPPAQGTLILLR